MKKENAQTATGVCIPLGVFIVFLILKLTDLVDWSWKWVAAPLWIPVVLTVTIAVVYLFVFWLRYVHHRKH